MSAGQKWTKEPWHSGTTRSPRNHYITNGYSHIADADKQADSTRIVACVNACAGMSDPAAEIARLRDGLSSLRAEITGMDQMRQRDNAYLIAQRDELLAALKTAYAVLLQTDGLLRIRNQSALCASRDAIAAATGSSAEDVQNEFESRAAIAKVSA